MYPIEVQNINAERIDKIIGVQSTFHPSDLVLMAITVKNGNVYDYYVGLLPRISAKTAEGPIELPCIRALSHAKPLEILSLDATNRYLGVALLLGTINLNAMSEQQSGIENVILYSNASFTCPPLSETQGHIMTLSPQSNAVSQEAESRDGSRTQGRQ